MQTDWSSRRTLAIIIALTVSGFVVWIGAIAAFWGILFFLGISTDLWAMVGALSTAVTAAAILGGGVIAYRELDEIASSRHMDVADRLFEELNSDQNIRARRWVFQNLTAPPEEGIPALSDEGRDAIKQVLNSMDRVAFLAQAGWIPEEMIMPWISPMVVKSWHRLETYVDYESRRRNEPDYYGNVRELAVRCRQWREENIPAAEITWVENAL